LAIQKVTPPDWTNKSATFSFEVHEEEELETIGDKIDVHEEDEW
jgi:hypothetical protein